MKLEESMAIVKALADNSRLMIIQALLDKPQYVEELSERLNLAASTVSFHLKKLEQAHLVSKTKEQYYVVFQANCQALNLTLHDLVNVEGIEKAVQEERIQQYTQKVIRTFFKEGKLQQIPAQHKKRWLVLAEIAKRFQSGRSYTEQEVNAIILPVYEDYCTIRRELVEQRLLARHGATYWVAESSDAEPQSGLRKSFQESLKSKGFVSVRE